MSTIDEARRVAADMLRQAGDETGARVLELVPTLWGVGVAAFSGSPAGSNVEKSAWDVLASLDPAWAEAEVERAWGEARAMHFVRYAQGDFPGTPEERGPLCTCGDPNCRR